MPRTSSRPAPKREARAMAAQQAMALGRTYTPAFIRRMVEASGMTQQEFGEQLRLAPGSAGWVISRWIHGAKTPSYRSLVELRALHRRLVGAGKLEDVP